MKSTPNLATEQESSLFTLMCLFRLLKCKLGNVSLALLCLFGFSKNSTYKLWSGLLKKKLLSLGFSKSERKQHLTLGNRKIYSFTHESDFSKATVMMPARPPITPGKPCRLWTPHVSWILSLVVKNG